MSSPCDGSTTLSSTSPRLITEEIKKEILEERKSLNSPPEDRKSVPISTLETLPKPSTPKPLAVPTSFSEWQLLAVLQRANLVQYYDTFIAQGGDDINQIMQCDEQEFLEIMSLVGMLSKPLHVRRLQRSLTEFSKDQASFNLAAIQQIGPPPPTPQFPLVNSDPISYLMPEMAGLAATLNSLTSSAASSTSQNGENSSPVTVTAAHNSVAVGLAVEFAGSYNNAVNSSVAPSGSNSIGGTANVCAGQQLLVDISSTSETEARASSPLLDYTALSEDLLSRIATTAHSIFTIVQSPSLIQPKLVQNKKRVSSQVLDLIAMSTDHPDRVEEFRKYSAIYGRFDTKRRSDKNLTLHEVMVNEAAAQLCLLMPALLTRRDDLFSLARRVVSEAGLTTRKRRPTSSGSPATSPSEESSLDQPVSDDKKKKIVFNGVDNWAASRLQLPSPPS